jgi:arsenate reductase-like glutaredoxin family protein
MMNIQIFGTKKSFDSKKAERYFKERGIKYQFIDMKEKGLSKGEFNSVCQAVGGMDQNEYQKRYEGYAQRFEKAQRRYDELRKEREHRQTKMQEIGGFLFEIAELDELPIVFDEHLWRTAVDHVTVYGDERLVFHFRCGREITERL